VQWCNRYANQRIPSWLELRNPSTNIINRVNVGSTLRQYSADDVGLVPSTNVVNEVFGGSTMAKVVMVRLVGKSFTESTVKGCENLTLALARSKAKSLNDARDTGADDTEGQDLDMVSYVVKP
jgi:hypothetical protein